MINLDYICFLNETGYGQAAFDLISALTQSSKYKIKITCMNGRPSPTCFSQESLKSLITGIERNADRNSIQVYHCIPTLQMRYPRNQRAIGFATFETFDPPNNWVKILNQLDAVICPSKFNYKIFAHAGVNKPLFYLPHCFDKKLYHKDVMPLNKYDKFTFLYFGTWKKRKGWPQLLEAYLEAFKSSDNVQLLIKTDKINVAAQEIEKFKQSYTNRKDLPPILLERRIFDDITMPSFYKSCDCLVMPTLGEGFGLPALQCMAVKTPVIITNFSGCQDYANVDSCTLLEPAGFMLHQGMDQIVQFANKKWPYITIETIKNAMLEVYQNRDHVKKKADVAYSHVHANFTYDVAYKVFNEIMETVYRVSKI